MTDYLIYPPYPIPPNFGTKMFNFNNIVLTGWQSGSRTVLSAWEVPMREITLDYGPLLDNIDNFTEFEEILGFYLACRSSYQPFLFSPYFSGPWGGLHQVVKAPLGTGDGVTTDFSIVRPIGSFGYQEEIDFLDPPGPYYRFGEGGFGESGFGGYGYSSTLKEIPLVYLDDVLQEQGYGFRNTTPVKLFFDDPEAIDGKAITCSYNFFFLMRFKENSLEFKQVAANVWVLSRCTLIQEPA